MSDVEKLGYQPQFDGLRGLAVTAVILGHIGVAGFESGGLGVDVFFALSGFLITALLIEEYRRDGDIDLRAFWRRRALRLLPCLLAVVAACVAFAPLLPADTGRGVVPALLYFTNWHRALVGDVGALGHTWSLAIEEQFYLLWPATFGLLARFGLRRLLVPMVVLAGVVVVAREVLADSLVKERIYNGSDLRADGILLGCALALALYSRALPRWVSAWPVTAAAVGAAAGAYQWRHLVPSGWTVRFLFAVATCAVVASIMSGRRIPALDWSPLRWVGSRCYGLYLWHYPISRALLDDGQTLPRVIAAGVLSVAVAAASYRWLELPFLRMKRRPAMPAPAPASEPVAPLFVGR